MIGRRYQKPGDYPPAHPMARQRYRLLQAKLRHLDELIKRIKTRMIAVVQPWIDMEMVFNNVSMGRIKNISWTADRSQDILKTGTMRGICTIDLHPQPPIITTDATFKRGS
jgi:hypothetical protein